MRNRMKAQAIKDLHRTPVKFFQVALIIRFAQFWTKVKYHW